jgi:hypothetical protein
MLASMFAFSTTSLGEACLYGLYGSSPAECPAIEKKALNRVSSAKTICYSANSQVQWSKNNKEPLGAFAKMGAGARIAMKGFTPLYSCERADLVVKIDYDAVSESVTLAVTDAESGDSVFHEMRSVSDLSSDVTRMSTHFQSMRADALAEAAAAAAEVQAKERREVFLANLPRNWRYVRTCKENTPCPEGPAVDVWVSGGILYEASTDTLEGEGSIKSTTHCAVKQGADEVTPWTGYCTYTLSWANWTRPTCTVQTNETITTISTEEITGRSQRVDYSPLHQTPPRCPVPAAENRDFSLTSDRDQPSK